MALEIPLDLINQLQISLRKEAGIPSFDPNDSSLPPPSDSIAEGDPSPPNLRCKHCKSKLLRGAKSVICAYCGRHQTREGAPEPINFRSSSGCRWFLQSLELEGSEAIALQDGSPLFDLLNLQVRWNAEAEKLEASISDGDYFFPRKSSLSSARVDDETFPERKGGTVLAVPEGESMENEDVDAGGSDDFEDLRKPSLFENAPQSSGTVLSSTEEKSAGSFTGWEADFQGAGSGTHHEVSKSFDPFVDSSKASSANLSPVVSANNLFDAKEKENSTEPAFPPEQLDVNVDVKAVDSKTLDGDFDSSDGWDDFKGPAGAGDAKSANDMKSMDVEEKKGDTFSDWETGLQSTIPKSKPEESSFVDPFVSSSVDLSSHIDGVFGSGKDLFDGKSNANTISSSSNSNNWFADDLWSNATPQTSHQGDKLDKTVKGDGVTVEYPSSEAVGGTTVSQDYDSFGDWDDFKGSSTLADGSTSSSKEAKPASSAEEKIGDSLSGFEAGFQSANPVSHKRSVSFDPFLGSSPDLSSQIDTMFGSGKPLSDNKAKDGTPSASITSNWLEGDLWSNATSGVTADKNHIAVGNQPNPLHTSSNETPDQKIDNEDNEDDDFFDSWNAFKSSAQAANHVPVSELTSKAENIDLTDGGTPKTADLKTSDDKNNDIFDSWNDFTSSDVAKDTSSSPSRQPDNAEINPSNNSNMFSGGFSNQNGSSDVNIMPGEASLSNRMADPSARDSKDVEVPGTSTTSAKSSDLDTVMSQMHDLSFMLENDLSIPPQG